MTTELAVVDGEIIEEHQPITLFGTTDPVAVVQRASTVATALADVLRQKQLTKRIGNRDHVLVEGWTLLGSMLGVFAEIEWTRPTDNGWEARAVARTLAGQTVGAAEAMCAKSERTWSSRDDYAIRSMAQTRAVSKALRLPLGFIMELAGYSATPAEELNEQSGQGEATVPSGGATSQVSASGEARPAAPAPADKSFKNRGEVQMAIFQAAHDRGMDAKGIEEKAKELGIERGKATIEQLLVLLVAIERGEPEREAAEAVA